MLWHYNLYVLTLKGSEQLYFCKENKDFYFQIFEDKFLVEIGPCKHGKYKDSIFQETYVYDIIAHVDALRHTILTGDKVLAPMEPDGERYSPGVVIDGQEKRYAEGKNIFYCLEIHVL